MKGTMCRCRWRAGAGEASEPPALGIEVVEGWNVRGVAITGEQGLAGMFCKRTRLITVEQSSLLRPLKTPHTAPPTLPDQADPPDVSATG